MVPGLNDWGDENGDRSQGDRSQDGEVSADIDAFELSRIVTRE